MRLSVILVGASLCLGLLLEARSERESWIDEIVLFFSAETRFSQQFTETSFGRVGVGDTPAQVRVLLGDPLHELAGPGGGIAWHYSDSPASDNYRRRVVVFESGRVVEVVGDMYWD